MKGTPFECIQWLANQDQNAQFEVTEAKKRRKRSLTQNAYYWVMLNKLAAKLRMSDSELHKNMLREYGVCDVFSILDDIPIQGYFRYYDVIGHGYVNGRRFKHIKVYKGSSQMTSVEFSRLVDGMREECVLQGIDVATPQEIAEMRWVEPAEGK
jgi:hypothetical protein